MKTARWLLILLVTSFTLTGCTGKSGRPKKEGFTRIVVPPVPSDFTLSQAVDSIRFVALETRPDALIGSVSKLVVTDSVIFILDRFNSEILLAFNQSGKFLFQVGTKGQGPGEYIDIQDFCLNSKDEVVVADFSGKKIIWYDHLGDFIQEVKTDYPPDQIEYLSDSSYVVTSFIPDHLFNIFQENGKSDPLSFSYDPNFRQFENYLMSGTDGPEFCQYFDDTIYKIRKDRISPSYLIDFGDKKMLRSDYLRFPECFVNGIQVRNAIPKGTRFQIIDYYESEDLITFHFSESGPPDRDLIYFALYDKNSGRLKFMEKTKTSEDLFGLYRTHSFQGVWKNQFIKAIDSYLITDRFQAMQQLFSKNKPQYLPSLEALRNSIIPESNPVLVFMTLIMH